MKRRDPRPLPGEGHCVYLNPRVPEVQAAAAAQLARISAGMAEDTPEDWGALERDLLRRFILSERQPPGPKYFIHVGGAARPHWEGYLAGIGCRRGAAPSDREREAFERQLAAMVLEGRTSL